MADGNSILSLLQVRGPGPLANFANTLDLELRQGEFAIVDARDIPLANEFANLCCGLSPPLGGEVRFLERDWTRQPRRVADALRSLIGRMLYNPGWLRFLDADANVLLPQLHHTWADVKELREHAVGLALYFGLPGLPVGPIGELSQSDLVRLGLVRTFLGSPRLIILESPVRGLHEELISPILNKLAEVRDGGGAVIWMTRSRMVWDKVRFLATKQFRIDYLGLTALGTA